MSHIGLLQWINELLAVLLNRYLQNGCFLKCSSQMFNPLHHYIQSSASLYSTLCITFGTGTDTEVITPSLPFAPLPEVTIIPTRIRVNVRCITVLGPCFFLSENHKLCC